MRVARSTGLKLQVTRSYDALSRVAASVICRDLKRHPNLLLCASAGATPTRLYELLALQCVSEPGLFRRMRVLQIDEWAGLPSGHPASCEADLRKKLLDPLHIPRERFRRLRTNAPDLHAECRAMTRWLASNGPIDICILGLGTNGHVAMNEPADMLRVHAHVSQLSESSRRHGMLENLTRKPRYGLTLGMGDILNSRRILLLVNGERKRPALKRLMEPSVSTHFPATLLWLHPNATILYDRAAAPRERHK